VVLAATGNALAIAKLIAPHAGEVVPAQAKQVRTISHVRVKTDRFDARVLAELLAADLIPKVRIGDQRVRTRRRPLSRRGDLVKRRTQVKNGISAVLQRNLNGRPPMSDFCGRQARAWLAVQELPADERLTVEGGLRRRDFFGAELAEIDGLVAVEALGDPEVRRPPTMPGVDVTSAVTLIAVIGDARRFPSARHLVGRGAQALRALLLPCSPAARTAPSSGPAWCAVGCAACGAARGSAACQEQPRPDPVWKKDADAHERRLAEQAESAYQGLVADWMASRRKAGAGATVGRESQGPSGGPGRAAGPVP